MNNSIAIEQGFIYEGATKSGAVTRRLVTNVSDNTVTFEPVILPYSPKNQTSKEVQLQTFANWVRKKIRRSKRQF